MRLLKSKAFLGGICLLLAAGIAFFVVPRFYAGQKATTTVVRASQEIPAGSIITEAMVTTAEVGAYGLPDRIAKDKAEVVGKVAIEPIHAGEFFWTDTLATEDEYKTTANVNTKGLEDGYCLVTVKCDEPSAALAGVLRPGNLVDVFECTDDTEDGRLVTIKALEDMYVYDVLNSALVSLGEIDKQRESAVDGSNASLNYTPVYVVIRCTEAQAQTLITLEKEDAIHMTLQRTEG